MKGRSHHTGHTRNLVTARKLSKHRTAHQTIQRAATMHCTAVRFRHTLNKTDVNKLDNLITRAVRKFSTYVTGKV